MDELQKITGAASGLYYISETDHPFEVKELTGISTEKELLAMLGRETGNKTEKQDLEYFFRNMVKTYEGATPADEHRARRFREFKEILERTLSNIEVYRFGEITIDAVITGTTPGGKKIAIATKLVET